MEPLLNDRLTPYHKVLLIIFIPVCMFITVWYGWMGYSTLAERPGLNGDWYFYYQLTRSQFYMYNFVVALIAFILGACQIIYLITRSRKKLVKTFWFFTIFIALVIAAEIYLESRRIYKG